MKPEFIKKNIKTMKEPKFQEYFKFRKREQKHANGK